MDTEQRTMAKYWIIGGPFFIAFALFQLLTLDDPVTVSVSWPFGPWLIDTLGVRGVRIAVAVFFAALGTLFTFGGWRVLRGKPRPQQ